ncbi:hypothetical protein [Aliarcobacter butzleri]|uniref:hypothetical protein n=1 Tax=Aliarcobacter butzleri TaxID=28197 RepID=UPI002B24DC51|nr:hypothetical protein [Aliarcobacter butzleri]
MSDIIHQPQKVIAKLFGYTTIDKNVSINATVTYENEDNIPCKCCGHIQDSGYMDPTNILISKKANHIYSFQNIKSPFFCTYCYFIQANYHERYQKVKSTDIADIVVFEKHYEKKDFKTDSTKNDLYFIFKTPPKPPFIIMIKEQITASAIVNMAHRVKPTLDKNLIVVNYGLTQHIVDRKHTLQCLKDFIRLKTHLNKREIKASDEVFFNRTKSTKYDFWFTPNLRANEEFLKIYKDFFNTYNESTRFIAKIMLQTYIEHNKKEK